MKNAPVYFVLAQVRFNQISALESYAATIQDNFRKAGYPDYSKTMMATINLGAPPAAGQMPLLQVGRHIFLNESKTEGFILEEGSLSYQTTAYDVFSTFQGAFIRGMTIVHDTLKLDFFDRLGVRFLDAIHLREGEKPSDYLSTSLVGMTDKLEGRQLKHSVSETWSSADNINLMCRVIVLNQVQKGVATPPDLQPFILQVAEKFREIGGIYGIIDTDCWHEGRSKFDIALLKDKLGALHADVRRSFNDMVTPHALRVWE